MPCCDCEKQCAPHIPLDSWRVILSYNPFYFWQLAQDKFVYPDTPIPDDDKICNPLAYKQGWQKGTVGRDEVWRALIDAEQKFSEFTGYYPFPTYDCYEQEYYCPRLPYRVKLPMQKTIEIGREQLDFVETLTVLDEYFSDRDGDGVIDWVDIPVPTGIPDGATLFFVEEDWCDKPLCRNEISPLCIEDGTISGHAWLFVRPILYGNVLNGALDPNDLAIYANELSLYTRTTTQDGAVMVSRRPGVCTCDNSDDCYIVEDSAACVVNHEQSVIEIRDTSCICPQCVDKICIYYLSGDCDNDNLIVRMAAANLGRDLCCCENHETAYWMQDFVNVDARGRVTTPLRAIEVSNFFGTRRGQIEAYRRLRRNERLGVARI